MASEFEPPPTFALPVDIEGAPPGLLIKFDPHWVNWFYKLVKYLNAGGGPLPNPTISIISNQVFGPKTGEAAMSQIRKIGSSGQNILGNQIFGG